MINCKNCRYWQPIKDSLENMGICREAPPHLAADNSFSSWPNVGDIAMCGRGKAITAAYPQPDPWIIPPHEEKSNAH